MQTQTDVPTSQHRWRLYRLKDGYTEEAGPLYVEVELTRFRGRLTRPNFGAEVAHEVEQESRTTGAARI